MEDHRTTQTQNKHTQTSMPPVGFEPMISVLERVKTVHALGHVATVIGIGATSQLKIGESGPIFLTKDVTTAFNNIFFISYKKITLFKYLLTNKLYEYALF
jgi:hypothetical protein